MWFPSETSMMRRPAAHICLALVSAAPSHHFT
jgi:hypothetical protein